MARDVPRYQLLELLGRGGMGEVYRARQTDLDRIVALKLVLPERCDDPQFLARFRREAIAMGRLNHPSIVAIHEFGELDGRPFLSMEYIDGVSLRTKLRRGLIPRPEALEIIQQLCDAISYAHSLGIVHRDLKPENVLVATNGRIKIADFGLAKLVDQVGHADLTAEGAVLGTLRYMAPEQLEGARDADARADVYSLGVMIYELLTGKFPVGRFPAPSQLVDVTPQFDAPVLKALESKPERRFATARELGWAIERAARLESGLSEPHRGEAERSDAMRGAAIPGDSRGLESSRDRSARDGAVRDGSASRTAATSSSSIVGRLPQLVTSLVGREDERQLLRARMAAHRLLTLTGPGGTGKTRLAIQLGYDLASDFSDGVWFVSLAEITDPRRVADAIAAVLGVRDEKKESTEALIGYLADRRSLLILDNFEQIAAAAPLIARLLDAAPQLRVIVTSRMALRLSAESVFPVGPLSLPDERQSNVSLSAASTSPAVALFVARAQAARPDFVLTPENSAAVIEICRRLDGLPLAIELAAARVRLLAPESLVSRLASRLKILTGGARDLPTRQQTMRAAIAWSYELLSPSQRTLLSWLTAFRGAFTVESAERLTAILAQRGDAPLPPGGEMLEEFDVLDAVAVLVDHSLLRQVATVPNPRFSMYETIREYAEEELNRGGSAAPIRHAHAEWCLETVRRGEPEMTGSDPWRVAAEWDCELPDFRAALAWWRGAGERPDDALRILGELWFYWTFRGNLDEGREELAAATTHPRATPDTPEMSRALHGLGTLYYMRDRGKEARAILERALEIRRRFEKDEKIYATLGNLAMVKRAVGDSVGAIHDFEEVLAYQRRRGDVRSTAIVLSNLALARQLLGNFEQARTELAEAVELYSKLGDRRGLLRQRLNLGRLAHSCGLLNDALREYEVSFTMASELADTIGIKNARLAIANILTALGRFDDAEKMLGECERDTIQDPSVARVASFYVARGYLHQRTGRMALALADYRKCLRMRCGIEDWYSSGETLVQIAEVYSTGGRHADAARLLGGERRLRLAGGFVYVSTSHESIESTLLAANSSLGVRAAQAALEEGAALQIEKLIELAEAD